MKGEIVKNLKSIMVFSIIIIFFAIPIITYYSNKEEIVETNELNYYEESISSILKIIEDYIDINSRTMISELRFDYDNSGSVERFYLDFYNDDFSKHLRTTYAIRYNNSKFRIKKSNRGINDLMINNSKARSFDSVIALLDKIDLKGITMDNLHHSYRIVILGYQSYGNNINYTYKVNNDYIIENVDEREMPIDGYGVLLHFMDKSGKEVETKTDDNEVAVEKEFTNVETRFYVYTGDL